MAKDVKRAVRRQRREKPVGLNDLDVFINCPFDDTYKPIFNAIVYTVVRSGYRARCALETDDAAENRLFKIIKIVRECRFAVHDISRTAADGNPPLPRFNMPLELGLWLGARHLGGAEQQEKRCIVFDVEQYRFQRFISDIAGQDIHAHGSRIATLISELSAWLRHLPGGEHPGGGEAIMREYEQFEALLPGMCDDMNMTVGELKFTDFNQIVSEYVISLKQPPEPIAGDPAAAHA
ncbi:hypothetical protein [Aureimonas sp. ME7]|uniref:hypothetical protein n=1 Tax=Aureimonas sp. ME7 TaxID=2744252 RepID=UPI001FCE7722|nr:hypothetical protein [Aureimonas sp. ME7]